jgi:tripeptide aminopeptidase
MTQWTLDPSEKQELLARFLRYVQVDTQSDEDASCFPSTEKQKDLARMLVEELRALGCADAAVDEWGYVFATVPANLPADHPAVGKVPPVGFLAHLDTYAGTPGGGVKPQIIETYGGGDILLPATGEAIPMATNPALARCLGHTLVHTDGTTLLGADDKAGIAEIMTMVAWLGRHPEFHHGELRIGFTPDEEVGRGTEHFDAAAFRAKYAYTLDGSDLGEIEDETFCADSAIVSIKGHDVHPGYAKNVMINAVRVASALVEALPADRLPETTEGKEPYLHPYLLGGDVTKAEVKLLVRAFTEEELRQREDSLRQVIAQVQTRFPGAQLSLEIKESYRNMAYKIAEDPKVLEFALEAVRRQGIEPVRKAIRGGTDGSRLSFMGILTPNIFAGGQSFHSLQEWVSLEWMAAAVGVSIQLLSVWVEGSTA